MPKRKTSISVDENLWKKWTMYVVETRGSARKLSEEVEKALLDYMREMWFKSEEEAYEKIKSEINLCESRIDVMAIAATSIVNLFEEYESALKRGKNITVWLLDHLYAEQNWAIDPKDLNEGVIEPAKKLYDKHFGNRTIYKPNLFAEKTLRSLIESTEVLWKDLKTKVNKEVTGRAGRLEIAPYKAAPHCKIWLFDEDRRMVWGTYDPRQRHKGKLIELKFTNDPIEIKTVLKPLMWFARARIT